MRLTGVRERVTDWYNLYGEGWGDEICPESYSHPAKYARGLIRRIYQHALEQGWFREGDVILDPFGGVALGAADALAFGLNWLGKELERPFVDMGAGCECTGISKEDWVKYFGRWDRFRYCFVDGRHWCPRCLAEAKQIIEPQPPTLPGMKRLTASYERNSGRIPHTEPHHYTGNLELFAKYAKNGAWAVLLQGDSRNLADVLDGALARGVVTSPPYTGTRIQQEGSSNADNMRRNNDRGRYGTDPANLGNMREGDFGGVVSSPPYAGGCAHTGGADPKPGHIEGGELRFVNYGRSAGQLAAMPEGLVSSPPFEASMHRPETRPLEEKMRRMESLGYDAKKWLGNRRCQQIRTDGYGNHPDQLGNSQGDTFWSAARQIVEQCYQVLAPGAVAIWVLKSFVRNKEIVDFPGQWEALCQSCGFSTIETIRAWLVEDRGAQWCLNGDLEERQVARKSFFRRLYENKYPENSIDYEVVLCMRKAA